MRGNKKNKSIDLARGQFLAQLSKRRHFSLTTAVMKLPSEGVQQLIELILSRVMEQDQKKQSQVKQFNHLWQQMDALADTFYTIQQPPQPEVNSILEEEPQPEEKKVIGLALLKRTMKKLQPNEEMTEIQESARSSLYEGDRKDRDGLIQRLRKQYSTIINSRYLSESMPIGESRADFMQPDTPVMEQYRKELNKEGVNKKGNKRWKESLIRKQNKVSTIYKKNINFIQKIDPTSSMYKSVLKDSSNRPTNRKSINYFDGTFLQQEPVVAKESTYREVANSVKPTSQTVHLLGLKSGKESIRFPNIQGCDREELSKRINSSLHGNFKLKKQIQKIDRPTRQNNSISMSYLPKISNRKT